MQFQCLSFARVFVGNYHFELGLLWSQCPDFDHSIEVLKFVVQMGQKWGMFPCFDHHLSHENRNVGQ